MEKEIFTSELEKIARENGIRIVIAKKMGRRWSHVVDAGVEMLLPSRMIHSFEDFAVFVEGEVQNEGKIVDEIQVLFEKLCKRDCE